MKRVGNLYEKLMDTKNLELAIFNASKGKSHYWEVRQIMQNPLSYVYHLHELLADEAFENSPYEVFTRQTGGKIREIYKLPFYPDRVLHHAIVQVLQPVWMRLLIHQTYSTIPGRGVHEGVRRLKKDVMHVGAKYCLKLDIQKFYPSVSHEVLLEVLSKKIKDKQMLSLLGKIVRSAPGIPIGNYISQWFGNVYLSYFDHWVKETLGCKYYHRYCDDLVLLSDSKEQLHGWLELIRNYLQDNLKLKVKRNHQVFPVAARGIDFLGYRFFRGYTLVRKSIVKSMKRRQKSESSMASYYGWLVHADACRLIAKYYQGKAYAQKLTA